MLKRGAKQKDLRSTPRGLAQRSQAGFGGPVVEFAQLMQQQRGQSPARRLVRRQRVFKHLDAIERAVADQPRCQQHLHAGPSPDQSSIARIALG
jgi:hypothetical protein